MNLTSIAYTPGQTKFTFAGGVAGTPLQFTTGGQSIGSIRIGSGTLNKIAVVQLMDDFTITGNTDNNGAISTGYSGPGPYSSLDATGRTLTIEATQANGGNIGMSAGGVVYTLAGSTFIFSGGFNPIALTTAGFTFHNIQVNNGQTVNLQSALTMDGSMTINAGGVFAANSNAISIAGNWTNSNSAAGFTPGTQTVTFNGASSQTITGQYDLQRAYVQHPRRHSHLRQWLYTDRRRDLYHCRDLRKPGQSAQLRHYLEPEPGHNGNCRRQLCSGTVQRRDWHRNAHHSDE